MRRCWPVSRPGDVVLVKASRGLALDTVAADLLTAGQAPDRRRPAETKVGPAVKTIVFAGCSRCSATLLGTRLAIRVLVKKGYGQLIRDDGPTSHHVKRGTPTMGGLVIIAAVLIAYFGSPPAHLDPPVGVGAAGAVPVHRARRGRLPGRLHQDQQAALARAAQQGQDRRSVDRRDHLRAAVAAVP